jgi:hypothetical protein
MIFLIVYQSLQEKNELFHKIDAVLWEMILPRLLQYWMKLKQQHLVFWEINPKRSVLE